MVANLLKFLTMMISSTNSSYERQMLNLAKTEYGRDWEWAYQELMKGKMPRGKGVTQ
jgi:hypothetical protein